MVLRKISKDDVDGELVFVELRLRMRERAGSLGKGSGCGQSFALGGSLQIYMGNCPGLLITR
jgi:hypothetical protein